MVSTGMVSRTAQEDSEVRVMHPPALQASTGPSFTPLPPLLPPQRPSLLPPPLPNSSREAATVIGAGTTGSKALNHVVPLSAATMVAGRATSTTSSRSSGPSPPQVVLLLVGVPGSGKSTFCKGLEQQSCLPWVRVNQDSIKKGKGKAREACIKLARKSLQEGKWVVVDR
jgi:hypothetical protein